MSELTPHPAFGKKAFVALKLAEAFAYQRLGEGLNSQTPYGLQLTSL